MAKLRAIPGVSALLGDDVSDIIGRPTHPHVPTPLSRSGTLGAMKGLGMIPNTTGLPFGFSPMAYSNDNGSIVDLLAQGVFQGLQMYAAGSSSMFGGASGGITNAAFTTWGSGGRGGGIGSLAGIGGGAWAQSGASKSDVADYIRRSAALNHIDPTTALRVAASEGLGTYTGDYGTSFGAFQLHYGGSGIRGMNASGLGDIFTRVTGLNARDPKTWKAQIDFAMRWAAQHGWGDWHGAARVGIGRGEGIGTYHGPIPEISGPPPRKVTPGAPAAGPEITAENMPPVHVHLTHVLDGKVLARSVTRHQAVAMRFPTSGGGPDNHGHYVSPGTPVTDAA